ncbi:MAG: hemerythrin domain-containing protein [Pseudonocardiaceae bacterium]
MQDVAQIIANDHRRIEELLATLESRQGDARRLVDQVIDELSAHTEAEEQVVYPAVRDMVPGGGRMADQAIAEHKIMKQVLAKLEQSEPGALEFENTLTALVDSVRDHVPDEENQLLPALRAVIGQDKMEELGQIFQDVKGTVPTR